MGSGSSSPDQMGTGRSTSERRGSKQADSGSNAIDYTAAMSQYKTFLDQLTSQSCAIDSSLKVQNATLRKFLMENRMSRGAESDQGLLQDMLSFNQESLMNMSRSTQLMIENFKTISQPVIDALDHQAVALDNDNVPTKTSQVTNQKLQSTGHRQKRPEVKLTGRSYPTTAEGTTVDKPDREHGEVAMHHAFEELKKENDALKKEVMGARETEQKNNKLLKDQQQSLKKVSTENDDLHTQTQSMTTKIRELESDITLLKRKNRELENDKRFLQNKQKSTSYQLPSFLSKKPKITVKAQLYCPRKGELASAVVSEMSTMLQTQFNVDNVILDLEAVDQGSSIRPGVPVMVICINASRLGTDVATALQNLTVNKSMSLVVMHHKDIHALPNQTSDRVLTAAEYKQLGGIFDMAFLSGKGIYPCDMNNSTVSAIVGFIKQHNDSSN